MRKHYCSPGGLCKHHLPAQGAPGFEHSLLYDKAPLKQLTLLMRLFDMQVKVVNLVTKV